MFKEIDIDLDGAGFEGFVHDRSAGDNFLHYLKEMGVNEYYLKAFDALDFRRITIFKNMWVDEDKRGQGYGSDLLTRAFDQHYELESDLIVLLADNSETEHFNVSEWYAQNGFSEIDELSNSFTFMIYSDNEELVETYKNAVQQAQMGRKCI